jgi:hypothetical protein
MRKKLTFLLSLFMAYVCQAQSIEKFSIDSGGASATAGGVEILYTIGEVNVQELSAGTVSVSEGFINSNMKIKIDPKLFLQGPFLNPVSAGLMNDNLRQNTFIPTTSPYADAATCNASVFSVTGDNAIVDWIWVELRAENDNEKLINGKSALLQRDGDVVGLDGVSNVIMEAAPTNYYVVVKHRNHLGAMSASTIALNETTTTLVDFTNSGFSTFGSHGQVVLGSGELALWTGNVNGDTHIQYAGDTPDSPSLLSFVLNDPGNFLNLQTYQVNGYNNYDIDMNGITQYTGASPDTPFILQSVLSHPSNFLNLNTYKIIEQLPEN